jgi:hypothetical protein
MFRVRALMRLGLGGIVVLCILVSRSDRRFQSIAVKAVERLLLSEGDTLPSVYMITSMECSSGVV